MADEDTAMRGGAIETPDPQQVPALADFLGNLPEGEAQGWGADVAGQITDWMAKQATAAQNTQIGQNLIDDVSAFTDMMTGLVRSNPTATDMAISVGNRTADALVNDHPYLPEDQKPAVAAQLKSEMAAGFARNGIMAAGQKSADVAHDMLDRLGVHLPDELVGFIRDHIDMNEQARNDDAAQQAVMQAKAKVDRSTTGLLKYSSSLVDPRGESIVPPAFNSKVLNDNGVSVPGDMKIAQQLAQLATNNAAGGEKIRTKTADVLNFIQGLAAGDTKPQDALSLVLGGQARMQDGVLLAQLAQKPDDARAFGSVIGAAKRRAQGTDGEVASDAINGGLDALTHNLLIRYRDMGSAAFVDLPQDLTTLIRQPQKLVGYQQWPSLNEIFARPERVPSAANGGVTVLRGGGNRVNVPQAELGAQTTAEDFASISAREHERVIVARQTMLPDEARKVWQDAQKNIDAARQARDEARQNLVDERHREHQETLRAADLQRRQDRAERQREANAAREERAQQAAQAAMERAAERQQAADERRQARAEAAAQSTRATKTPLEQFRSGYTAVRRQP